MLFFDQCRFVNARAFAIPFSPPITAFVAFAAAAACAIHAHTRFNYFGFGASALKAFHLFFWVVDNRLLVYKASILMHTCRRFFWIQETQARTAYNLHPTASNPSTSALDLALAFCQQQPYKSILHAAAHLEDAPFLYQQSAGAQVLGQAQFAHANCDQVDHKTKAAGHRTN